MNFGKVRLRDHTFDNGDRSTVANSETPRSVVIGERVREKLAFHSADDRNKREQPVDDETTSFALKSSGEGQQGLQLATLTVKNSLKVFILITVNKVIRQ